MSANPRPAPTSVRDVFEPYVRWLERRFSTGHPAPPLTPEDFFRDGYMQALRDFGYKFRDRMP